MGRKQGTIINEFVDTIKNANRKKTSPYDTEATVKRIEGNTAWVHIPGGVEETPVKLTINAKAGDKVQVRVGGGRAWLTGNATSPPTDDTGIKEAKTRIMEVERVVADKADISDLNATNAKIQNLIAEDAKINNLVADKADISDLNATNAKIQNLIAEDAKINNLVAKKADIDLANITNEVVKNSWIDKLMVQSGLLASEGTVYYLDAINVNASKIKAGTLDVERLVVTQTDAQGKQQKYMVHIDPSTGNPSYEKLDGNIIEDLTITADKIVAGAITADKITTQNIEGTGGWINLRNGTFQYVNASTMNGISWDGKKLTIQADSIKMGAKTVSQMIDDINIGGRNLFRLSAMADRSHFVGNGANKDFENYPFIFYNGNASLHNFTEFSDGVYQDTIALTPAGNIGIAFRRLASAIDLDPGSDYTISVWAKCSNSNVKLSIGLSYLNKNDAWIWRGGTNPMPFTKADTWQKFTLTFKPDADTHAIWYYIGSASSPANAGTLVLRQAKMEKGNKATDWTPAPEDIDSRISETQSLIEQTDSNIRMEVSKVSSIKYLTSASTGWTLDQIKSWSKEGYDSNWSTTGVNNARVGDTVYLKSKDTTRNCDVYIKLTITSISGTTIRGISHGYEDVLPVDTIKSTINLSPEAVKIAAKHVEIDGTAIFSAIKSNVESTANAAKNDAINTAKASAVRKTQRIYYRSNQSSAPTVKPTKWLAETGNKWNGNSTTVEGWSTKVTPISNGTAANATKYLYLWTCEQRELANGTLEYTNVLLDDSTTVIDGGKIITGSVTANQLSANAVTAGKIAANAVTAGTIAANAVTAGTIATGAITIGKLPDEVATETDVSTAKDAAIKTAKASAVRKTQRIYYRSNQSSAPTVKPTKWLAETGNKWNGNSTTVEGWSTKVTPISNGTAANATKYLYLWTCEQRELANGTLEYTNVLLDDSTTVIDGGKIITGSVTANQLSANAVTTDKIATGAITIGKLPSEVATDTEVTTAKTAAINTAATDATNKANAAKTAAINTAATDATNKANAAEANGKKEATNYISANSSGIKIASANPSTQKQRLELTSSKATMYDSGDVARLTLDSSTGVVVGRSDKGHTTVNDAGLTVYDVNNKKGCEVNTNGMTVYKGGTQVAQFGRDIQLFFYNSEGHGLTFVDENLESVYIKKVTGYGWELNGLKAAVAEQIICKHIPEGVSRVSGDIYFDDYYGIRSNKLINGNEKKHVVRAYNYNNNAVVALGNNSYPTRIYGSSVWANKAISTSDERMKKDFIPLDNAKDFLMDIDTFSYKWDSESELWDEEDSKDDLRHFGVSAQNVMEKMKAHGMEPGEYSLTEDSGVYYGVTYSDFIPLLIRTVQDQQKEIDELKKQVSMLLENV